MTATVRYAAGTGAGVAAEGGVLLAAGAPSSTVVREMWARMAAGLDRAGLLAAITESGLVRLESFALLLTADPGLVLVRGAARVLLDGPDGTTEVGTPAAATWTEVALPAGTTSATLLLEDGNDVDIPATAGVFPAVRLEVTFGGRPAVSEIGMADVVADEAPLVEDAGGVAAHDETAPDDPWAGLLPTPETPGSEPAAPEPAAPEPAAPEPAPVVPAVPAMPAAPPPTAPAPPAPPAFPPPFPHPAPTQALVVPSPPAGALLLTDGSRVELDKAAVLGRNPEWHGPGERHLVAIKSPFGDVSRSHVAITVDAGRAYAEDLGSTNGTLVAQPAGVEHLLEPGVPEELEPGAIITLAKDVTVTYASA